MKCLINKLISKKAYNNNLVKTTLKGSRYHIRRFSFVNKDQKIEYFICKFYCDQITWLLHFLFVQP